MKTYNNQKGQALITLVLIISIIAILFTHIATLSLSTLSLANEANHAQALLMKSEGYLEDAAIRYLRDTNYTPETLNDGVYSCTITITNTGGLNRNFQSSCTKNGRTKSTTMSVNYTDGRFEFSPIREL